jgi:hypothetical protein
MKKLSLYEISLFIFFVVIISFSHDSSLFAEDKMPWKVEGLFNVSHFQQQVKTKVGAIRGARLIYHYQLGAMLSGTYKIKEYFSVGVFTRIEGGRRTMAEFDTFDVSGKTLVKNSVGGNFLEIWFGPMLKFSWKQLSLDFGQTVLGFRTDDGRDDIASETGDIEGAFSLHPVIAWVIALGGNFELTKNLDFSVKVEYRPRYYSKRGGKSLMNDIEHGTMSVDILLGIGYKF